MSQFSESGQVKRFLYDKNVSLSVLRSEDRMINHDCWSKTEDTRELLDRALNRCFCTCLDGKANGLRRSMRMCHPAMMSWPTSFPTLRSLGQ
ncbi:MAG: hypothetical protein ACTSP4_07235 [Candidatus Hodarchaeales archaeon]